MRLTTDHDSEALSYGFLAIDRPLDPARQDEIRALLPEAEIAGVSVTGVCDPDEFGADPRELVERHFDAHAQWSNWGPRAALLRLPAGVLDLDAVQPYCTRESVNAWYHRDHVVIAMRWLLEDGEGGTGPGVLGAVAEVRAEVADGDLRGLYLAWLSAVTAGELDDQDDDEDEPAGYERDEDGELLEPPVPAGLADLTPAQQTLAEFLQVAPELLDAAARSGGARRRTVAELMDAASVLDGELD